MVPGRKGSTGAKIGKNFKASDIELRKGTLVWKSNQDNPDYRLCLIHAANPGFQAKMSPQSGSYLISLMTYKMKENVDRNNCFTKFKFFGEIIDEIQHFLHDKGKQQITFSFNNHTRKLKFKKNSTNYEEMEEDTIEMLSVAKSNTNQQKRFRNNTNNNEESNAEDRIKMTNKQSMDHLLVDDEMGQGIGSMILDVGIPDTDFTDIKFTI